MKAYRGARWLLIAGVLLMAGCGQNADGQEESAIQTVQSETEIDDNLLVVGFSQVGAESDWRIAQTDSIRGALTEQNGFYQIFDNAQQKQENQIKAIKKFILQEVDYIVLDPIVESGWDSVLQEAKDADIPVILLDRGAVVEDQDLYTCWLGSDFEAEGRNAGQWLEQYLEKEGRDQEELNIVILLGTEDSSAQLGRTKGFTEVLKSHEKWTLLDTADGDFTQAKGQESMAALLEKYDDIDVVISENDNMTFGAIDAIHAAGQTCGPDGDIVMISFDAVKAALERMQEGEIHAVFECNPLSGEQLADLLKSLHEGEEVEKIQYMEETWFDYEMDLESILKTRAY